MPRPIPPGLAAAAAVAHLALAQPAAPTVLSRLLWFDRMGTRLGGVGPVADHGNLELSPDGQRVAVAVTDAQRGTRDIWIYDTRTGTRSQFTSAPAEENWLIWAPDGNRVVFNSFAPNRLELLEAPAAGAGPFTALITDADGKWPVSWSPDGRTVLFVTNGRATGNDVWVLPLTGDRQPYPLLRSEASENWAAFSPDGRWVAFSSSVLGEVAVYVMPFPPTGRRWQVSVDGGSQARWRKDGSEIYYIAPDRTLMAVSVKSGGGEFAVTGFNALFQLSFPYGAYHAFDAAADGTRFLVNTVVVNPSAPTVVTAPRADGNSSARGPSTAGRSGASGKGAP